MKRHMLFALGIAFAGLGPGRANAQVDLETVVRSFHPEALDALSMQSRGRVLREQCYAVLDAGPTGAPLSVIAAYTNVSSAAVRLLIADGSGFRVASEPTGGIDLAGATCEVTAIDLTGDGVPEGLLKLHGNRGSRDWVFGRSGGQLVNMSPLKEGPFGEHKSELIDVEVIDANGDGTLELYSFSEPPNVGPRAAGQLYRLEGAAFVRDRSVVGLYEFTRASGSAVTDRVGVDLPSGAAGPFVLRVFNGAGSPGAGSRVENTIESGRIWLNGQEIVSPQHFGNNVAVIERTVTLEAENELRVRLAGAPGGRIVIVIDAANWTP